MHKYVHLLTTLNMGFFYVVVLVGLPLMIWAKVAAVYNFLNGLYINLKWHEIFLGSLFTFLLTAGVILAWALLVDGRFAGTGNFRETRIFEWRKHAHVPSPDLPAWADRHFGLPLSWHNLVVLVLLWLPFSIIAVQKSSSRYALPLTLAAFVMGAGFVWLIYRLTLVLDGATWLQKMFKFFGLGYLTTKQNRLVITHLFAFVALTVILITLLTLRLVLPPTISVVSSWGQLSVPAIVYLFAFLIGLVYVFGFLEFHLPIRLGVSSVTVLVIFVVIAWSLNPLFRAGSLSYTFPVFVNETPDPNPLTPQDVVAGDDTIVLVGLMGGGIVAASWSTFVLDTLYKRIPHLEEKVRLYSSVSGGSVGLANYLYCWQAQKAALAGTFDACGSAADEPTDVYTLQTTVAMTRSREFDSTMENAHLNARKSSLSSVAFALGYVDFLNFVTANALSNVVDIGLDRGSALQARWEHNASEGIERPLPAPRLSQFSEAIRNKDLPAFIMNTTSLETGERVMMTPLTFSSYRSNCTLIGRAKTFSEYVTGKAQTLDLDIWSAARLSATFPFVSPAARANLISVPNTAPVVQANCPNTTDLATNRPLGHHFLDGGYHDNYGMMSLLDFLTQVLSVEYSRYKATSVEDDSKEQPVKLKKVIILEMRLTNFEATDPETESIQPWLAETLGPLRGAVNVAFNGSRKRNDIALSQFVDGWEKAFDGAIKFEVIQIQPNVGKKAGSEKIPGPLSWHLTRDDECTLFAGINWLAADTPSCTGDGLADIFDIEQVIRKINKALE